MKSYLLSIFAILIMDADPSKAVPRKVCFRADCVSLPVVRAEFPRDHGTLTIEIYSNGKVYKRLDTLTAQGKRECVSTDGKFTDVKAAIDKALVGTRLDSPYDAEAAFVAIVMGVGDAGRISIRLNQGETDAAWRSVIDAFLRFDVPVATRVK
jgi:hypothetical protein